MARTDTRTDRRLDAALERVRRRVRLGERALVEHDERGVREVEASELVCRILARAKLSEREAIVVHDRYFLDMALWEVGDTIGNVGRERTAQIERRALEKLRKAARLVCH